MGALPLQGEGGRSHPPTPRSVRLVAIGSVPSREAAAGPQEGGVRTSDHIRCSFIREVARKSSTAETGWLWSLLPLCGYLVVWIRSFLVTEDCGTHPVLAFFSKPTFDSAVCYLRTQLPSPFPPAITSLPNSSPVARLCPGTNPTPFPFSTSSNLLG